MRLLFNPALIISEFSNGNKIGRGEYFWFSMKLSLISLILGGIGFFLLFLGLDSWDGGTYIFIGGVLVAITFYILLTNSLISVVRRLNSLNLSLWFILLNFVPYVNIVFCLILLFKTEPFNSTLNVSIKSSSSNSDYSDELKKWYDLYKSDAITLEEYNNKKDSLLK